MTLPIGLTNRTSNISLKQLRLCQFAFPVGSQPDLGQRAFAGKDGLGEEHASGMSEKLVRRRREKKTSAKIR